MASPLATPGLKSTQFLLASDMKIIEKYQNSSLSHGEDILVFYHTTNKLLCMAWWGNIFSNLLAFSGAKQGESEGDLRPFATLRCTPSRFYFSKIEGPRQYPKSPRNYPCRQLFCRFQIWTIYCGVRSVPQQRPLPIP